MASESKDFSSLTGSLLVGLNILVVEDQFVMAMEAEDILRALGAADVKVAATAGDALRLIEKAAPSAAILDINLSDGGAARVAETLRDFAIPYIFSTGYGDAERVPADMTGVPVLFKPYGPASMAQALGNLLNRTRG